MGTILISRNGRKCSGRQGTRQGGTEDPASQGYVWGGGKQATHEDDPEQLAFERKATSVRANRILKVFTDEEVLYL